MAEDKRRAYGEDIRREAARVLSEGVGHRALAARLGIPEATARQWARTFAVGGAEALICAGTHHRIYPHELKVAVVTDRIENGLTVREVMVKHNVPSESSVKSWCRLYREGGPDALIDKPRGRKPKKRSE